ncbi:MAG: hypothetical protein IIW72_00150, partial [Clostridia bacterium]|nr:hypothetical protein [Clostridia bacterium]
VMVKEKGHLIDEDAWTTDAEEGGIAPTCTSVGKSVNKCKRDGCVAPDLEKEVAKLAHNFSYDGAQKVTKHPTCTEEGYDFIKCSGCNEIQKSNIKVALGHDTSNNTPVVRAATCENEGSSHTDCNRYFVNGVYDATVTAENAEAKGAEKCNGINETIDALGHVYKTEYEIITPVTCDEDGTEARKCVRYGKDGCTAIDAERRVPATGHKFTVEKVIPGKEATCQRTGEKALYCANGDCKEYDTSSVKTVAKVDHDYSADWITDKQPTCLKNGEGHRFKLCKNCGEAGKIEETLPKLDHNITNANTATEPATCLEPGYTYKECQNVFTSKDAEGNTVYTACKERVKIDDIDATGHNLDKTEGSGYVKQDPTCTQGGFEEGFCKNCNPTKDATKGTVRINEVPATGHKFSAENTKIDPTCQKEGSITGVCQVNGCDGERDANGKVTQTLEKLEHAYGEWVAVKAESTKETHVLKRTCTTCVEAEATDSTPALTKAFETKTEDHTSGGWVVDKAATCGTAGSMTDYCAVCDYALDSAVIPATKKHNLKDVKVLSQPECEKVGSKTVECQNENCIEGADGKYTKYTDTV